MKKWKSLFACGLVLLLTGWTMLCIPFNAYAQTWEAESTSTNIVAVVDCSTSMQSSDSDWKIPESLDMLVDMCDDEQVRLSLIVYGTSAETAFRDFPLSAENHEMVKKQIHQALMVRGYNLGQTDTGAALGLAQQILEQQAGQNNMVLLFTDGAIRATRNGRTNEISEQEVDAFAAFAQNNGVVVNTLGLFNKQADAADVETAEEELSILRSKTGGMYQRVDDPADIPDFVIQLLAGLLDVKTLDLSSPTETTVDGKHAWQYDFSISDQYIKDLTVVWPAPVSVIQDILISGPATDGTAVSLNNWTDGEWVSTTRYNAKPGYQVIRIDTDGQKKGDYSVFFVTKRLTSNSQGVEFHLYYDDTQSMLGFVEAANGQNTFVTMLDKSIDCAKGMLNNGFSALKAYTLVDEIPGDKKNQELNWTEVDIVGALQAQFLRSDFYTGSHTGHREGTLTHAGTGTKVGPLARLFLDGNDPFVKGTFTVVVTDLREQGFDLDDLVNGLLSYREAEPGAEICIVGCISDYTGELSVPAYSNSNAGADIASIDNYDGPAAYYYIMAGPTEQMDQYIGMLQDNMQDENLVYATFEELAASEGKPLSFSLVKNTMEGKRTDDLQPGNVSDNGKTTPETAQAEELPASSAPGTRKRTHGTAAETTNTAGIQLLAAKTAASKTETAQAKLLRSKDRVGNLMASPYIDEVWGSANVQATEGEPTRQGAFDVTILPRMGQGKSEAFGAVSLISAYADLPDSAGAVAEQAKNLCADKTYWADLSSIQLYQKVNENWIPAEDATLSSVNVRFETVDGPLTEYNSQEVLLNANRHTGYLRVKLDNTQGVFDMSKTYLLSIPIHTSMKSDLVYGADQLIDAYNANIKEYTAVLQDLAKSGNHYRFDISTEEAKQRAEEQFGRTPKLDILVQQLRNSLRTDEAGDIQYVDFFLQAPQDEGRAKR